MARPGSAGRSGSPGRFGSNPANKRSAGARRVRLSPRFTDTGSITGAAKAVGMSYKAAWDAIDTMNNLAGEPLVVRSTGGKGGGGTTLTARAVSLIDTFRTV